MTAVPVSPKKRFSSRRWRRAELSPLGWVGLALVVIFLVLAIVVPFFTPDPTERFGGALEPPSGRSPFGTDNLGRDLLARVAAGARISLLVALGAVVLGLVIAVPLGLAAGFFGGTWVDEVIMRVMEALQALPVFVFALFVLGMLGTGATDVGPVTITTEVKVIVLLAISFLPMFARVARASTLVEMQQEYVDALRVIGLPRWRIVLEELLPNAMPPVLVQAFLWVGIAIFAESALSFLGLGLQPPAPSLGNVLADATNYLMLGAWWFSIIPGLVILLATVGINLLGDEVDRWLSG